MINWLRDRPVLIFVPVVALVIAGGVWALMSTTPGEHSWQGGSGPSTVCFYETRNEARPSSDGKSSVVVPVQYTVCRDAR